MKQEIKVGAIYQHYKGPKYRVLGQAVHSETLEDLVLYECLYENPRGQVWVRPFSLFFGQIEVEGVLKERFSLTQNP